MGVKLLVTIRTADRSPRKNYVRGTVCAFLAGGCEPDLIHLYPTDPDTAWLTAELGDVPVHIHAPDQRRAPNENGIAQISALEDVDAEWIGLFEDDLALCADPIGSMTRWLDDHARSDIAVYRFFALPKTPVVKQTEFATWSPLKEMRGSQAVVLRNMDARYFEGWARAHPHDWRPKTAPFQKDRDRGFDKLIGYWALNRWPKQPYGMVSRPMLVKHVGVESALYSHGLRNDSEFAGANWSYRGKVAA